MKWDSGSCEGHKYVCVHTHMHTHRHIWGLGGGGGEQACLGEGVAGEKVKGGVRHAVCCFCGCVLYTECLP